MGWIADVAYRLNKGCWLLLLVYAGVAALAYLVWRLAQW